MARRFPAIIDPCVEVRLLRTYLILTPLLLTLAGCGGGSDLAPVSGVVTLNGKPTAEIAVTFQPVPATSTKNPPPSAFGVTDQDGRYSLTVLDGDRKGASVGKNHVRICAYVVGDSDDPNRPKAKVKIPSRYWDEPAEFDVPPGGADAANFDLKSP
jgi:hypothetical protein